MKKQSCERAIYKILTRWEGKTPVKKIFGNNLPEIDICQRCNDVAQENQLLPTLQSIHIDTQEYHDALEHLNTFLPHVKATHVNRYQSEFMKSEYPDFAEDLINAFQRVLKIEAAHGIIRVPYETRCYDACCVPSKYPDHLPVFYAPEMYHCIYPCCQFEKDDFWRIGWEYVYFLCTAQRPVRTIEMVCDCDVTKEYHSIQNCGTQLFHVFNAYLEEEFLANEENEEYQHRNDVYNP